jgi:hypothetical protein
MFWCWLCLKNVKIKLKIFVFASWWTFFSVTSRWNFFLVCVSWVFLLGTWSSLVKEPERILLPIIICVSCIFFLWDFFLILYFYDDSRFVFCCSFFGGSEVFWQISVVEEVSVAAPPDAGLDLCFWFRMFYFVFLVFSHSLSLWCLKVTGLFVGLGARSVIFYLWVVL